jgi:hypothetical protein
MQRVVRGRSGEYFARSNSSKGETLLAEDVDPPCSAIGDELASLGLRGEVGNVNDRRLALAG